MGYKDDMERQEYNKRKFPDSLCGDCEGTGNKQFSYFVRGIFHCYKPCEKCGGRGVFIPEGQVE